MNILYVFIGCSAFAYHQIRNKVKFDIVNISLFIIIILSFVFGV